MTMLDSNPRMHATRRRARAGFTLIELVIAGVLAALVLAAVTFSLSALGKTRNLARDRVEAYQRAATALDAIRADVAGAIRSDDLFDCRLLITSGNTRSGGYDRSELLVFNSSLRPTREIEYQGEGVEYETAYRVEDDDLGSALWRRRDAVPDDVPDGGGVAEPIADGVVGIRIEASDGNGSWMEEWDSDYDGIPKLVRISVTATGAPVGGDETALTPEVTLRTLVAIDRVVPPKPDPPKEDEAAAAAAADADAAAAAAAGAGGARAPTNVDIESGGITVPGGGRPGEAGGRGTMVPGGPSGPSAPGGRGSTAPAQPRGPRPGNGGGAR